MYEVKRKLITRQRASEIAGFGRGNSGAIRFRCKQVAELQKLRNVRTR